jgi:hypothetical protein
MKYLIAFFLLTTPVQAKTFFESGAFICTYDHPFQRATKVVDLQYGEGKSVLAYTVKNALFCKHETVYEDYEVKTDEEMQILSEECDVTAERYTSEYPYNNVVIECSFEKR